MLALNTLQQLMTTKDAPDDDVVVYILAASRCHSPSLLKLPPPGYSRAAERKGSKALFNVPTSVGGKKERAREKKDDEDEHDFCGGNGSQTNMADARLGRQKNNNKTF